MARDRRSSILRTKKENEKKYWKNTSGVIWKQDLRGGVGEHNGGYRDGYCRVWRDNGNRGKLKKEEIQPNNNGSVFNPIL